MNSSNPPDPEKVPGVGASGTQQTERTEIKIGRAWPKSQGRRPRSIPPATLARLAHPAPPGQRHEQIVTIATSLVAVGFTGEEIHRLLRPNYGPDVPDEEIVGVILWALRRGLDDPSRPAGARTWDRRRAAAPGAVRLDPATLVERFLKGFRCDEADLWEASPVRPGEDFSGDAANLIAAVYAPGEIVNIVFKHAVSGAKLHPVGKGSSLSREAWLAEIAAHGPPAGPAGVWIRPNPTNGCGVSDADVTAHRFLLVEFDAIPLALQLPFLARLPLPIAAIITSGGKSLHAWVRLDAASASEYRESANFILARLAPYGVDEGNRNPGRLSRLPGVVRPCEAGCDNFQRLLYLDPHPANNRRIFP